MQRVRITALILLIIGAAIGFFLYSTEKDPNTRFPFSYGLDLDGGTRLVYRADTSQIETTAIDGAMDTLRRTIELSLIHI